MAQGEAMSILRKCRRIFPLILVLTATACMTVPAGSPTVAPTQVLSNQVETSSTATQTASPVPTWTLTATGEPGTATPVPQPGRTLEFSSLESARNAAGFPLMAPGFIPANLPFSGGWLMDNADGSESVQLNYFEPGDPLDANIRSVFVSQTWTNQPITPAAAVQQRREVAWDVQKVQVRGQSGFSYWSPGNASGNSAHLIWREESINYEIDLYGNWPQPDESNPHRLDSLLLQIAASLQPLK